MDPVGPALFVLAVAGLLAFAAVLNRAHTVVRFDAGRATLLRGALPPGLLRDLADVARGLHAARGLLELRGQGDTLKLGVRGLDDGPAQRVRNVVLLRRREIRRP